MMPRSVLGSVLLASLWAGCANVGMPVPVGGDVKALAGEWVGEYWSGESGRSGSIFFRLAAGTDTARGDVIMQPGRPGQPPTDPALGTAPSPRPSQPLSIAFVQVSDGLVSGRLDPYRDPDCGCLLATTFTGRVKADTLSGTYVSYHEQMGQAVHGNWRVVRKR